MSRPHSGTAKDRTHAASRAGKSRRPLTPSADPTGSVVDPVWLLRALGLTIGVALLCGYATFCLLFFQGQWQLVLHPTQHSTVFASAILGELAGSPPMIRFGSNGSSLPQLTGWWLPAEASGRYRHLTILYLPSGDGQVGDAASRLADLHHLGLNVFAFDYRGFGESLGPHPTEQRMEEDATTALHYLSSIKAIPESRTILYGSGVGASLAVSLLESDPAVPAIILDEPEPDILGRALADPRASILPVRLLFTQRFPLFPALASSHTPKLIITRVTPEATLLLANALSPAAKPKVSVTLSGTSPSAAIARFLDQYAPPPPATGLVPGTAPSPAKTR